MNAKEHVGARLVVLAAVLAVVPGCGGSPKSLPSCDPSTPCGSGSYCASTADGNVCWPDATGPELSAAALTCATNPCLRNAQVTVTATATDDSGAMGEVTVTFADDPGHPHALVHGSGNDYALTLSLEDVPFPWFEHAVAATVTARDGAGNVAAAPKAVAVEGVTRGVWTKALKDGGGGTHALYSPAVAKVDGRIIVADTSGSLHLLNKDGTEPGAVIPVGGDVSSPPVIGSNGIWVISQRSLLKRALADGAAIAFNNCTAGASLLGPPIVLGDRALTVSSADEVLVATISSACNLSSISGSFTTPPVVDSSAHVLVGNGLTLGKYTVAANSTVAVTWTGTPAPPIIGAGSEPFGVDAEDAVWTTATNGIVHRTTSGAVASEVAPAASASSTGSIVLSDGSAVLGDFSGVLRRYARAGAPPWATSAALSGHPRIPLALAAPEPTLLVSTSDGWVFAVRVSDGTVAWSKKLAAQALQTPNLWTEPGAKTSTAYLAGADGNLYAVLVDGALDTSAPWPKAFHDPQNTSNAATGP